eukprot:1830260-Amphidinium_carterae.1
MHHDACSDLVAKFANPETEFMGSFWNELIDIVQKLSGAQVPHLRDNCFRFGLDVSSTSVTTLAEHTTKCSFCTQFVIMDRLVLRKFSA